MRISDWSSDVCSSDLEFVVDDEQHVIKVPESAKSVGVLAEPMSIVQKAIDEANIIQSVRLPLPAHTDTPWVSGKKVLVAGIGAIGLLAVVALRLRGAEILGVDGQRVV